MDDATKQGFFAISDMEQLEAAFRNGDVDDDRIRRLLIKLVEVSNHGQLEYLLQAVTLLIVAKINRSKE